MKKFILLLIVLCLLFAVQAGAATRFVGPSGSGITCSTGSPCSVSTAVAATAAGDTIRFKSGTYTSAVNLDSMATGTTGSHITLDTESGTGTVIIKPSSGGNALSIQGSVAYVDLSGLIIDGSNINSNGASNIRAGSGANHLTFTNVETRNNVASSPSTKPGAGALFETNDITWIGGSSHDNGLTNNAYFFTGGEAPYGFYLSGARIVLRGVQIYNNGCYGVHGYNGFGDFNTDDEVSASLIYNNGTHCYTGGGTLGQGSAAILTGSGARWLVFNNLVFPTATQTGIDTFHACDSCVFFNNSIYSTAATVGLQFGSLATNSTARNNIVSITSGGNISNNGTGSTFSDNLCSTAGTGCAANESAGNTFTNASIGDLTLKSGSAAINRSPALTGCPSTDYAGTTRPQGASCDIGAYEYQSGGTIHVRANSTPGPVLLLGFNENQGTTTADVSGHGNNGLIQGTGTTWVTGKYGSALHFDGNGWVSVPHTNNSLDVSTTTIQAWVKADSTFNDFRAIFATDPYQGGYWYLFSDSADYFNCGNTAAGGFNDGVSDAYACNDASLPVGVWTHVSMTYDGANITFYKNGVPISSTPSNYLPLENTGPRYIGSSYFGEGFVGAIDEFEIFNVARTQAEIQSDMNTPGIPTVLIDTVASITSASTQTLTGAASCSSPTTITGINWFNDRGGSGQAAGTTSWTAGPIPLLVNRVNGITITVICSGVGGSANANINIRANGANRQIFALAFDEVAGTTASDSSGNNLSATFTGTGNTWVAGRFGNAISLTGAGGLQIARNDLLDVSVYTFSASVKPKSAPANVFSSIYSRGGDEALDRGYYYLFKTGVSPFCPASQTPGGGHNKNGDKVVCDSIPLPVNAWTHLTVRYDGATLTFFKNGILVGTPLATTDLMLESADPLMIGTSAFSEFCDCDIDEFRGYNFALPTGSFNPATDSCPVLLVNVTVTSDANCRIVQAALPPIWKLYPDITMKLYPDMQMNLH